MGRLQELVADIEEGVTAEGWSISLDSLLLHLDEGVDRFYRFFYARGDSVADIPERFHQGNVDLLLEYLESRGLGEARRVFRRKGWYLGAEDLAAWEDFFVSVSLSNLSSHIIDEDDLEIALSGCQDPADGLRFYCEGRFAISDLVERALVVFARSGRVPVDSVPLLRQFTRERLARGQIREEIIFQPLLDQLRETAIRRGWIRDEIPFPSHLKEELALFGFSYLPDEGSLKDRYRDLLKKYHPDLNRESEAVMRTQQLNAAYARICGYAEGGRVK